MGLKSGIVGLPNVGKSTLFNALTNAGADVGNFPFSTTGENVGVVQVPDSRLYELSGLVKPQKITPTFIELVDIVGLVKGASEGKGRGNAFLSSVREVDLILHVVRCFEDENVMHVEGNNDSLRDIHIIEDELILKDLETLENRLPKLESTARSGDKKVKSDLELVRDLKIFIEEGNRAINFEVKGDEARKFLRELFLITTKPILYVCNISEDEIKNPNGNENVKKVMEYASENESQVIVVCAKIESELVELEGDDKAAFLEDLGIDEPGLEKLVNTSYQTLGLLTFFTAGPKEVRAWTVKRGSKAPQAAGQIHTDFERGFIRAETISMRDYLSSGSELASKEAGLMRSEGKEYIVQDGDVILFRFNV